MIELEILQFALGNRNSISHIPTASEWQCVYDFADRQAILGVMFDGIERLHKVHSPFVSNIPKTLLLEWIGNVESLRYEVGHSFKQVRKLCNWFNKAGFQTCILKGVGNLLFYDGLLRTTGDIDLWVMPVGVKSISRARRMTQYYVHTIYPDARGEFVHMDWPWKDSPVVEIHFTPSMDVNPWVDRKLQRFFEQNAGVCFANKSDLGFAVPTRVVNGVFLLHHMKRHFIYGGIGLRHVVDYALLLRTLTGEELNEVWRLLGEFNMQRFAKGVMYVIGEILGDRGMVNWPCDRNRGKFLLREMFVGGNFGQYDIRMGEQRNLVQRWMWFAKVSINRMRMFPTDAFWSFLMRLRIGVDNVINR